MPRSFPAFCFCLLVQGWLFACHAAETPLVAIEEFLAALRGKDPVEVTHPAMVVSPFCPAEKKTAYNTGLRELAGQVEGAIGTLQPVREPDKLFAGYMLVLRQKSNPLQVAVRPVCVLKTGKGWKVPAGVSHFDNTHFGFEPGLDEAAVAVSSATIAAATDSGRRMLEEGAENLWKEIRARRATWPPDEPPEALIRRFLDFDLANDAVGKLASFHITPDLTAASLERFLSLLGSDTIIKTDDENSPGRCLPWAVEIAGKEGKSQSCRVYGFLSQTDPSFCFPSPFYLRKGEGNRWLLLPDGFDVEGLRSPSDELENWYSDNEEDFAKQAVVKMAALGRTNNPPPATGKGPDIAAHFLAALAKRDVPAALGVTDIPDPELADDFDGMLAPLGELATRLLPPGAPSPKVIPMAWQEDGPFGGAVHAVFQPAAAKPFFLHLGMYRKTDAGWRYLPVAWDGFPDPVRDSPPARRLRLAIEKDWDKMKNDAARSFFSKTPAQTDDTASDPAVAARATLEQAFAAATDGRIQDFLAGWEVPGPAANAVDCLEMATRLAWQARKSGSAPAIEAVTLRGPFAGAILSIEHAKREDGQKPARMLLLRRTGNAWRVVPGVEFFRAINRGFKELNAKATRNLEPLFPPVEREDIASLIDLVEKSTPTAP